MRAWLGKYSIVSFQTKFHSPLEQMANLQNKVPASIFHGPGGTILDRARYASTIG
jgi:hypothetical protein